MKYPVSIFLKMQKFVWKSVCSFFWKPYRFSDRS